MVANSICSDVPQDSIYKCNYGHFLQARLLEKQTDIMQCNEFDDNSYGPYFTINLGL